MSDNYVFRKRAAVLCANVVSVQGLAEPKIAARRKLLAKRHKTLSQTILKNHGRVVRVLGDEILAVFVDAMHAVNCAIEFQKHAIAHNKNTAFEKRLQFRVGVGLGLIAVDKETIKGDAVDFATALQNAAHPDGVWVSADIPDDLQGRMRVVFSKVDDDVGGDPAAANFMAPIGAHVVALDKQAAMRAVDYLLPDGRGSALTLIAPLAMIIVLILLAYFGIFT
jgi:adenylate cyclase